jgi:hypothetical protein
MFAINFGDSIIVSGVANAGFFGQGVGSPSATRSGATTITTAVADGVCSEFAVVFDVSATLGL